VYEKTSINAVIEGEPAWKTPFGYNLEFAGWTHDATEKAIADSKDDSARAKLDKELNDEWRKFGHAVKLKVIKQIDQKGAVHAADGNSAEGPSFIAEARVFINNMKMKAQDDKDTPEYMRWPYIHKELVRDFYIGISNDPKRCLPGTILEPGQSDRLNYLYENSMVVSTGYSARYIKFVREGNAGSTGTFMGAEIEVTAPDGRKAIVRPGMTVGGAGGPDKPMVSIPELNGACVMAAGPDPATKRVKINFLFPDTPAKWVIPVAVTNKPMIDVVWLGVITMGIGTLISMVRRMAELRKGKAMDLEASQGIAG